MKWNIALKAAQHPTFKDFYHNILNRTLKRILNRTNSTKLARIALACKLLVIAFTLVKSKELFDPTDPTYVKTTI